MEHIEFFALHILRLIPVHSGEGRGFYRMVKRLTPKVKRHTQYRREYKTIFVSHEQVLQQYKAVNRFMRDLPYDHRFVGTDLMEGTPYIKFDVTVDGETYKLRHFLTPGMETLFDKPLTGGKQ